MSKPSTEPTQPSPLASLEAIASELEMTHLPKFPAYIEGSRVRVWLDGLAARLREAMCSIPKPDASSANKPLA